MENLITSIAPRTMRAARAAATVTHDQLAVMQTMRAQAPFDSAEFRNLDSAIALVFAAGGPRSAPVRPLRGAALRSRNARKARLFRRRLILCAGMALAFVAMVAAATVLGVLMSTALYADEMPLPYVLSIDVDGESYVADYNMTESDCAARRATIDEVQLTDSEWLVIDAESRGALVCAQGEVFSVAESEDSCPADTVRVERHGSELRCFDY